MGLNAYSEEELVDAELEYRPLVRIGFRENVPRALWKRLLKGGDADLRARQVYLHPRTLQLVAYYPKEGIHLHEKPEEVPKESLDLDAVSRLETRLPGELVIDEGDWQRRQENESILKRFASLFKLDAERLEPVLFPIWRLHMRASGKGGTRLVTIDALSGILVDW